MLFIPPKRLLLAKILFKLLQQNLVSAAFSQLTCLPLKNSIGEPENDILISIIFVQVLIYVAIIPNVMVNNLLKYKCFT